MQVSGKRGKIIEECLSFDYKTDVYEKYNSEEKAKILSLLTNPFSEFSSLGENNFIRKNEEKAINFGNPKIL